MKLSCDKFTDIRETKNFLETSKNEINKHEISGTRVYNTKINVRRATNLQLGDVKSKKIGLEVNPEKHMLMSCYEGGTVICQD
jgi:hypothetical protein